MVVDDLHSSILELECDDYVLLVPRQELDKGSVLVARRSAPSELFCYYSYVPDEAEDASVDGADGLALRHDLDAVEVHAVSSVLLGAPAAAPPRGFLDIYRAQSSAHVVAAAPRNEAEPRSPSIAASIAVPRPALVSPGHVPVQDLVDSAVSPHPDHDVHVAQVVVPRNLVGVASVCGRDVRDLDFLVLPHLLAELELDVLLLAAVRSSFAIGNNYNVLHPVILSPLVIIPEHPRLLVGRRDEQNAPPQERPEATQVKAREADHQQSPPWGSEHRAGRVTQEKVQGRGHRENQPHRGVSGKLGHAVKHFRQPY
mmetsp:Transcript_7089/g.12743  ORF Transcript_7089/g.12743 Transcript_7089/m.12743 type:complete len:313 (+) Transcript_7089:386-1324(+)